MAEKAKLSKIEAEAAIRPILEREETLFTLALYKCHVGKTTTTCNRVKGSNGPVNSTT